MFSSQPAGAPVVGHTQLRHAVAPGRRGRFRRGGEAAIPVGMDLPTTLAIAGALIAVALFAGWRGARPWDPRRGPRMIPWRPIMVLAAALAMPFLVHALNLVGLVTGPNSRP